MRSHPKTKPQKKKTHQKKKNKSKTKKTKKKQTQKKKKKITQKKRKTTQEKNETKPFNRLCNQPFLLTLSHTTNAKRTPKQKRGGGWRESGSLQYYWENLKVTVLAGSTSFQELSEGGTGNRKSVEGTTFWALIGGGSGEKKRKKLISKFLEVEKGRRSEKDHCRGGRERSFFSTYVTKGKKKRQSEILPVNPYTRIKTSRKTDPKRHYFARGKCGAREVVGGDVRGERGRGMD